MPWYEYRCNDCGYRFSKICSIAERGNVECNACGSAKAVRLISPGVFVIDGRMSVSHPNSPEGMQRARELRKKYQKRGKRAFDDWVEENKARHKIDKTWRYSE